MGWANGVHTETTMLNWPGPEVSGGSRAGWRVAPVAEWLERVRVATRCERERVQSTLAGGPSERGFGILGPL